MLFKTGSGAHTPDDVKYRPLPAKVDDCDDQTFDYYFDYDFDHDYDYDCFLSCI